MGIYFKNTIKKIINYEENGKKMLNQLKKRIYINALNKTEWNIKTVMFQSIFDVPFSF